MLCWLLGVALDHVTWLRPTSARWISEYASLSVEDKVAMFRSTWLLASASERMLILTDMQFFFSIEM